MTRQGPSPALSTAVTPSTLEKIAGSRIYFGHQSVGYNILDGILDILHAEPGSTMQLVDTRDPAALGIPVFAHAAVGKNRAPDSKLADFAALMKSGIGSRVNIAFLKFCYVDITAGTDVKQVFAHYEQTMALLKKQFPGVAFVHVTAPLTADQTDVKTSVKNMIKKMLGKPVSGYKDNVARDRYNNLLRNAYSGKEPIFDLAAVESTLPDGGRTGGTKDGATYPSLAPAYTDDGGHLNQLGRRIVAAQLLNFLSELPLKSSGAGTFAPSAGKQP